MTNLSVSHFSFYQCRFIQYSYFSSFDILLVSFHCTLLYVLFCSVHYFLLLLLRLFLFIVAYLYFFIFPFVPFTLTSFFSIHRPFLLILILRLLSLFLLSLLRSTLLPQPASCAVFFTCVAGKIGSRFPSLHPSNLLVLRFLQPYF